MSENWRTSVLIVTGSSGSGKSTVSRMLGELGFPVIDADALAREALAPGSPGLQKVRSAFGATVFTADGTLDRKALGAMVFADPNRRKELEALVHPEVRRLAQAAVENLLAQTTPPSWIIYDCPLFFESDLANETWGGVIVVTADDKQKLARLASRDGLPAEILKSRLAAQLSDREKSARADFIVVNDGTVEELREKVRGLVLLPHTSDTN